MRSWLLAAVVVLMPTISANTEAASPAQYWIVAPVNSANPTMTPRPKTPYAYGWFGTTQTHCEGSWHRGYYRPSFIDWTFR